MRSQFIMAAGVVLIVALAGVRFTAHDTEVSGTLSVDPEALNAPQRLLLGETIDINTADQKALEALTFIGPALARRIVADRERNGPFGSIHDLMRVYGVGPRIVARNSPYLTVKRLTSEKSNLH